MTLFALFNLIHQREYKRFLRNLLKERIARLYEKFDGTISYSSTGRDTHYYALIDILLLADSFYKEPVGKHMVKYFYPVDFVYCLAIDGASVCLPGYGFFETDPSQTTGRKAITTRDRKNWAIRVSLANLEKEDYSMLGQHIMEVLAKYYADYQAHKK